MDRHHIPSPLSIHDLAEQGNLNQVKALIEQGKASADEEDNKFMRRKVLHYAAESNQAEIVEFLLAQGAKVDIEDRSGFTPLHYALFKGHLHLSQLLLEKGADPNKEGAFYLFHAAEMGYAVIVEQLLRYGADANLQTYYKETALHFAVRYVRPPIIVYLYKTTNLQLKNVYEQTPIEMAIAVLANALQFPSEIEDILACLYAFLLAGAKINTSLIANVVGPELFPQVMTTIQKSLIFKKKIEYCLGHLGTPIIHHILLQLPSSLKSVLTVEEEVFRYRWKKARNREYIPSSSLLTLPPEILDHILKITLECFDPHYPVIHKPLVNIVYEDMPSFSPSP
jgi:ankyrin repeat protein